jgi:hypothetical protein
MPFFLRKRKTEATDGKQRKQKTKVCMCTCIFIYPPHCDKVFSRSSSNIISMCDPLFLLVEKTYLDYYG